MLEARELESEDNSEDMRTTETLILDTSGDLTFRQVNGFFASIAAFFAAISRFSTNFAAIGNNICKTSK